jgi:hypothetical protein
MVSERLVSVGIRFGDAGEDRWRVGEGGQEMRLRLAHERLSHLGLRVRPLRQSVLPED